MSIKEISGIIFGGADHYITSAYGRRNVISTSGGTTSTFHNGIDFGTNGKKIPQYAVADGYIFAAQRASDGALYVWVIYPKLKKAMLHYHLDRISVSANQPVKKGTELGRTGKTGKATGVHLHLGVKLLDKFSDQQIKNMNWSLLRSVDYVDPDKQSYRIADIVKTPDNFFPAKGYFAKGDTHKNIGRISDFMYRVFPAFTNKSALGDYYGKHLVAAVTEFQKRTGLVADGQFGPKTLAEIKKYGFKP